ncbi:MAG: hypothetical protein LBL00_05220 [Endomicrobium sp.]|nr:hypothetical protein [Endomicrobium sp.]
MADTKYLTGWSSLPLKLVVAVHPSLIESVTGNPRLQLTVAFAIAVVLISFAELRLDEKLQTITATTITPSALRAATPPQDGNFTTKEKKDWEFMGELKG